MNPQEINSESDPVLSVEHLGIKFLNAGKTQEVVSDVSFTLNRGTTLGIVGESGSGKTLTALSVIGLIPKPAGVIKNGTISFHESDGHTVDLLSLPENEMRHWRGKRIAMIFQEPMTSLNPAYRCGKQVMENLFEHENITKKEARKRTLKLFGEVMLPDPLRAFRAYPHELSGGQKQRIMIAMAMACNPDVLIADEPTTALDVTVQKTILRLLKTLQQKHNISLIFISHNLDVVAEIADRVLVMYQGKIVESGLVNEIFDQPQHPYTKGLLACRPSVGKNQGRLQVLSDFMGNNAVKDGTTIEPKELFHHVKLFEEKPVLITLHLNTSFILKRNFVGKPIKQLKAVNDVSFEIYPGETLGLVGESGSGKTTLGRSLLRLIEPTSGIIKFKNIQINDLNSEEMRRMRKNIQIIFQDPYSSLNPRITAGEAILAPMRLHKLHGSDAARKEKVFELLEKVGLEKTHYGRYPHEFSGGQRQRICIARALAVEPELIICDESVSALDVSVQAQVLNLLNDLKKEFGLTYLFISHDLSVVRYMSDRIMVMYNGEIQEIGEADEVYSHPKSAYSRILLDALPHRRV